MELQKMKEKFTEGKVPLPDFWGGFRIQPGAPVSRGGCGHRRAHAGHHVAGGADARRELVARHCVLVGALALNLLDGNLSA